eukprot:328975-Pleurochrysis_carterae.AAC.1
MARLEMRAKEERSRDEKSEKRGGGRSEKRGGGRSEEGDYEKARRVGVAEMRAGRRSEGQARGKVSPAIACSSGSSVGRMASLKVPARMSRPDAEHLRKFHSLTCSDTAASVNTD